MRLHKLEAMQRFVSEAAEKGIWVLDLEVIICQNTQGVWLNLNRFSILGSVCSDYPSLWNYSHESDWRLDIWLVEARETFVLVKGFAFRVHVLFVVLLVKEVLNTLTVPNVS